MINYYSDEYYMGEALKQAYMAYEKGEIPVGAVVVCGDKIIARAHNLTERLNDVTAHAEMQAITSAAGFMGGKYLTDCTLFVTLEPCVMCAGALNWAQLKRVVFGADDEKRGFRRYSDKLLHPKTTLTKGILKEQCSALMIDFFKARR